MEQSNESQWEDNPFIFVVDDVLRNLQVMGKILEDEGYDVAVASNGPEALEMIVGDLPDLILLDVMMPDMSGFEVCKELKKNLKTKDIPVIFLTAKTETEDIVNGFKLGGVDYITKPFKKDELLVRIKTHLELKFSKEFICLQNDKLKLLNCEKNEFLGIAAHDLKNPLSAIMSIADILADDDYEINKDEAKSLLGNIRDSSRHMLQLVADLLDINAIEEGKLNFRFENFTSKIIAEESVNKFKRPSESKKIDLQLICEANDLLVYGDQLKSQQILDNLVSNAVKFSPFDKRIFVKVYEVADENVVYFEVKDEGPGISSEDQKKLFGKFQKLTAQPTGDENSTGLGLSIVKRLVGEMGGRIWVDSEIGKGAAFKFTLPKSKNVEE